jgi:hypothetical protein
MYTVLQAKVVFIIYRAVKRALDPKKNKDVTEPTPLKGN